MATPSPPPPTTTVPMIARKIVSRHRIMLACRNHCALRCFECGHGDGRRGGDDKHDSSHGKWHRPLIPQQKPSVLRLAFHIRICVSNNNVCVFSSLLRFCFDTAFSFVILLFCPRAEHAEEFTEAYTRVSLW